MDPTLFDDFYEIEQTHWWSVGMRGIFRLLMEQAAPPAHAHPLRLIDVGCGTGIAAQEFARYGAVLACDLAWPALTHARRRGDLRLCRTDLLHLPARDGDLDVALALDVIEHLEDDAAALSEIYRVLRPGGLLLVNVPAFQALWSEKDELNRHCRRYSRGMLRERLEGAGFHVERMTFANATLFVPIWFVRQVQRRLRHRWNRRREYYVDGRLNRVLLGILQAERQLLRRVDLPFGTSVAAIARKLTGADGMAPRRIQSPVSS